MKKSPKIKHLRKRIGLPLAFLAIIILVIFGVAYAKQDAILKHILSDLNTQFEGKIVIERSVLSPFEDFPYLTLDLKKLEIHESKSLQSDTLLFIEDAYVGIDVFSVITGDFKLKHLRLKEGFLHIVQEKDGSFNILNALSNAEDRKDTLSTRGDKLQLNLDQIELINIDVSKLNKTNNILVDAYIKEASASLKATEKSIQANLNSQLLFNLIIDEDPSFLHDKQVFLQTAISYDLVKGILRVKPSTLAIEKAQFALQGQIDVEDNLNLNLNLTGQKPNFDLFLAFAPPELNPVLSRYKNGGQVYFDATIKGSSINGYNPHVEIDFGCKEAFVENATVNKEVNDLFFEGHFTNGSENSFETAQLSITDFEARPGTGTFKGQIEVKNFNSPDIDMQIDSEFDLDFLTQFFNVDGITNASGLISLKMNFHDIIDIDDPSKAIERFNESYFTELKVKNLNFTTANFHLPVQNLSVDAYMDGHSAIIESFRLSLGNSDLALTAKISDLPAIIHHTAIPVDVDMKLSSNRLDLKELTQAKADSVGLNEELKNLSLNLKFKSSAQAFTESPNLPLGEFLITKLYAELTNYPHQIHDFKADVMIDSTDFRVIDFTGMIDKSDFHFDGKLSNYDLWFEDQPQGETFIDFDFTSSLLQLKDLFSYKGENYVPEDYRNEEFKNLKIHGVTTLNFENHLKSTRIQIDKIEAQMKVHQMQLENFKAKIYIDSSRFQVAEFGGKIGRTAFTSELLYFRNNTSSRAQPHVFSFTSPRLDFDQLFSYRPQKNSVASQHEAAFNIFELPFSEMDLSINVNQLNYHRLLISDFSMNGRMQKDHFVYLDTLQFNTAGGQLHMRGYFNGSQPEHIYFSPKIRVKNMDLDRLLFKFDNFGQDQLLSENLHGKLSGQIEGKVELHPDLVPIIEDSELSMDVEIVEGSLKNFQLFNSLSDYFTDKNLNLVRFDTLQNTLRLKNGELIIPAMTINSSLGYFEISGLQRTDQSMDYTIRIPLKLVAKAGLKKLFGKKDQDNSGQVDAIQYRDEDKKTSFINLRLTGTPEDYDISLGKKSKS